VPALGRGEGDRAALADLGAVEHGRVPVHGSDDVEDRDLVRGPCEPVAAIDTGHGGEHVRGDQRLEQLGEVRLGQVEELGQPAAGNRRAVRLREQPAAVHRPLDRLRQFHDLNHRCLESMILAFDVIVDANGLRL
jgi:hypothetical protein